MKPAIKMPTQLISFHILQEVSQTINTLRFKYTNTHVPSFAEMLQFPLLTSKIFYWWTVL